MLHIYIKHFRTGLIVFLCCLFVGAICSQTTMRVYYGPSHVEYIHLNPTQYGDFIEVGDTLSGIIGFVLKNATELSTGCDSIGLNLSGQIAVISDPESDTDCSVSKKINNAMEAGAAAVILVKTSFPSNYEDPNDISDIPVFTVLQKDITYLPKDVSLDVKIYYKYEEPDEVIWGDKPGEGDFADGLGDWTTVGVTSDTALWQYEADAQSNGPIRHFLIDSPTKGNGCALMDNGVYIENGGIPDTYPYGDVGGQLISPVIDLSQSGPITIKWYQYCIGLNTEADTYIGLYYSLDGGSTWIPRISLTTENVFNSSTTELHNPEIKQVFLPQAAGVSEFMFKFEFRSDFYAMLIDDVQIVRPPDTDLAVVGSPFYTPASYAQPEFAIQYDTFHFLITIENNGLEVQENISIKADVIDLSTGDIVETVQGIADKIIPVGEELETTISETYVPKNLPKGEYKVRLTVIPENPDAIPGDNSASFLFKVTDNTFAMGELELTGWYSASDNYPVGVANIYEIPAEVEEEYVIANVKTSYKIIDEGTDVTGKTVTILVTALPDSILDNFDNLAINDNQAPSNQQAFEQIAYQDIPLDGTNERDIITATGDNFLDASEFKKLDEVPLVNGTRYIIWTLVSDSTLGVALNYHQPITRDYTPMIYGRDDGGNSQYYGYFFSGVQALVMMQVALKTTIDKTPLPETSINIFPNPVLSGKIKAELQFEKPTDATITIAGMNGLVHSINVYKNVMNRTIVNDVSDLPAGTYLIRLATDEGTKTMKFIKL